MKFVLASAVALVAVTSLADAQTTTPTIPKCDTAVAKAWLTSDNAKKCHAPIGYPAATYAPPNATTFEAFCPNEFCMKTLSAVLALKPTPDYDCYTVFKGNWNFYSTVVDVFANACKSTTPAPTTSSPAPTTTAPAPTTSAPAPTPTPTTTAPPTLPRCDTAVAKAWLTSDDAKKCHPPIGYPAATYAPPNATTFEAFCPNEFCMKTLSAVLALKPTPDYDCYTVFKGNWNFYSTVVDVFANACKSTTPAPTTSSPAPTTTAPAPTTSAPAPTPTPTTTAPPTLPRCDTAVAKAWLTSDDAKKCHPPIGYPAATYAPPNATTFEAFCPNEFCMKTLSAVLALKPTPDYDCYTVFKGNWNFYSTVVDVFANACKSVPTPSPSSSPPTPTSSPPTPTSSPPTPTSSGPSPTPTSSSPTPTSVTPSPKPRPSC